MQQALQQCLSHRGKGFLQGAWSTFTSNSNWRVQRPGDEAFQLLLQNVSATNLLWISLFLGENSDSWRARIVVGHEPIPVFKHAPDTVALIR